MTFTTILHLSWTSRYDFGEMWGHCEKHPQDVCWSCKYKLDPDSMAFAHYYKTTNSCSECDFKRYYL